MNDVVSAIAAMLVGWAIGIPIAVALIWFVIRPIMEWRERRWWEHHR